jgi:hypothetical protein
MRHVPRRFINRARTSAATCVDCVGAFASAEGSRNVRECPTMGAVLHLRKPKSSLNAYWRDAA